LTPAIADDELRRALVLASLVTLGRHAPRRDRVRVALAGLRLATAVRMVDRIHHDAADGRAHAAPARRTRLAELLEVVLGVADLANRGAALGRNLAHLARTQAKRGIALLARDQL